MVKELSSGTVVCSKLLPHPPIKGYTPNIYTVDYKKFGGVMYLCRKIVPGPGATPSNPKNEYYIHQDDIEKIMGRKLLRW